MSIFFVIHIIRCIVCNRYILPDAKCGLEFACCRASSIKGLIGSKGLWAEAIEVHPQIQHDCGILAHVSDPSTYMFWFQEGDVRDGLSFLLLVFLLSLCYCFFCFSFFYCSSELVLGSSSSSSDPSTYYCLTSDLASSSSSWYLASAASAPYLRLWSDG